MDCDQAKTLIYPYLSGRLNASLVADIEQHLGTCQLCPVILHAFEDKITAIALSVPQVLAPDRIRQALLARIDGYQFSANPFAHQQVSRFAAFLAIIGSAAVSRGRTTSLLVGVSLLLGGLWLGQSLSNGPPEIDTQAASLLSEEVATPATDGRRLLLRQHTATAVARLAVAEPYAADNGLHISPRSGTSIRMLHGTRRATEARGLLIATADEAMLLALNLPPLPSNKVYQIWLVKADLVINASFLSIDRTGYGQTIIIPYLSVADFDGIGITIEPASGSADPTGESVLQGDL